MKKNLLSLLAISMAFASAINAVSPREIQTMINQGRIKEARSHISKVKDPTTRQKLIQNIRRKDMQMRNKAMQKRRRALKLRQEAMKHRQGAMKIRDRYMSTK